LTQLFPNKPLGKSSNRGIRSMPLPSAVCFPFVGLTAEPHNAAVRLYCSAFVLEFAVNDLVDRISNAYQSKRSLDPRRIGELQIQEKN